ncbi:hypothetical protein R3P38DRAFT_2858612 [Favolaschia claudopus]|uniref:Stress-response A/B barrel domain-containing protein n=1 Tax=Favolaschia claudopus TaxID=2862362 RepID=A0AAW0DJS6_9AGAR
MCRTASARFARMQFLSLSICHPALSLRPSMAVQLFTFAKFRREMTAQQKNDAYRTVYLLLAAGLAIPGFKDFKVGPPLDKRGTRGYEFALTVEFEDMKAYSNYIPHAHHILVSEFINAFSEGTPLAYQIDTTRVVKL